MADEIETFLSVAWVIYGLFILAVCILQKGV